MNDIDLINYAIKASENSYSKYSGFSVGAALLVDDDKIFIGTNVENSSYPVGVCAEKVAVSSAITNGYKKFKKLCVYSKDVPDNKYIVPCGSCRQFICEFCDKDFKIILAKSDNEYITITIGELLPCSFDSSYFIK